MRKRWIRSCFLNNYEITYGTDKKKVFGSNGDATGLINFPLSVENTIVDRQKCRAYLYVGLHNYVIYINWILYHKIL